jgi:hypothetical protein
MIPAETTTKKIVYTVDGEPQETHEKELTPREILLKAGFKPEETRLYKVEGKERIPLPDLDKPIHVHEHEKFVTGHIGPTPVS